MTALLWSCGDDDNGGSGLKPSSITLQSGDGDTFIRTFSYDEKNRLQTMTSEGSTYTFAYNSDGNVSAITRPADDPVTFQYAANGDLESFTTGDSTYPVTQLGENSFSISGDTYEYMANGDWKKFDEYQFTYGSGKGPFANVKKLNGLAMAIVDNESFLYAVKKKMATVSFGEETYPVTATAGDNGLPSQYQVSTITMQFTYAN